jgi:hypothetical protein
LKEQRLQSTAWWQWVLGIDLFFVITTVFLTYHHSTPIFHYFNLGGELNFASWWSGINLLSASLLCYKHYSAQRDRANLSWLVLAFLFSALSCDEIGSLHERIIQTSWSDYYSYGLAGVILLTYALGQLFSRPQTRISAGFILLGFLTFATVAIQEYLEHEIGFPYWLLGIRAGVEEGSELVGMLFCLLGILHPRVSQAKANDATALLLGFKLPFNQIHIILLGGLLLHTGFCVWVPHLTDLPDRGNPALWYPIAIFFLMFTQTLQTLLHENTDEGDRKVRLLLAINFLIFSLLLCTYKYPWEPPSRFYILHSFELLLLALFFTRAYVKPLMQPLPFWEVIGLSIVLVLNMTIGNVVLLFEMSGLFAYLIARFTLNIQPKPSYNDSPVV